MLQRQDIIKNRNFFIHFFFFVFFFLRYRLLERGWHVAGNSVLALVIDLMLHA